MRQLRKCFFKIAMGLGVMALLLAGSSAQAGLFNRSVFDPARVKTWKENTFKGQDRLPLFASGLNPALRCRECQPLMLVQEKASEKEKKAMEQLLGETQKQQKSMQPKQEKAMPRELMRPGSPGKPTTVQDAPARAGTRKFGAQPIRSKEPSQED